MTSLKDFQTWLALSPYGYLMKKKPLPPGHHEHPDKYSGYHHPVTMKHQGYSYTQQIAHQKIGVSGPPPFTPHPSVKPPTTESSKVKPLTIEDVKKIKSGDMIIFNDKNSLTVNYISDVNGSFNIVGTTKMPNGSSWISSYTPQEIVMWSKHGTLKGYKIAGLDEKKPETSSTEKPESTPSSSGLKSGDNLSVENLKKLKPGDKLSFDPSDVDSQGKEKYVLTITNVSSDSVNGFWRDSPEKSKFFTLTDIAKWLDGKIHSLAETAKEPKPEIPDLPVSSLAETAKEPKPEIPDLPVSNEPKSTTDWDADLEKIGGQLGSTPGGIYKSKSTGEQFYVKQTGDQAAVEAVSNRFYRLLGVKVPTSEVITFGGTQSIKSKWKKLSPADIHTLQNSPHVQDNFVVDAWLGNWDAVGLNYDNMAKSASGSIYRLDHGGTMYFRAQGGQKAFTAQVPELESMRDPSLSPQGSKVFGNITSAQLMAGANKVMSISNENIKQIVNDSQIPEDKKQSLITTLKARRDYIGDRFKTLSTYKPAACPSGKHSHAGYTDGCHPIEQHHYTGVGHEEHKTLGLSVPIGSTSTEDLFTSISKRGTDKQKEILALSQQLDFSSGDSTKISNTIRDFCIKNGLNHFQVTSYFNSWQSGGKSNHKSIAAMRSAFRFLRGEDDQVEADYWIYSTGMSPIDYDKSRVQGEELALSFIPFIEATRQYLKQKNGDVPVLVWRGVNSEMAKQIRTARDKLGATGSVTIPNDGISGYSLNHGTSVSFAGSSGIVLHKRLNISDIFIYFNVFSSHYSGEQELVVDNAATKRFTKAELELQ